MARTAEKTTFTIRTFIRSLIGGKKELANLQKDLKDPVVCWDGLYLKIYSKGHNANHEIYDKIEFSRHRLGIFRFVVESRNYWYFTINFSDEGLKKNKEYPIKNYI